MRRLLAAATLPLLLGGCAASVTVGSDPAGPPQCSPGLHDQDGSAVLMAQSVTTASLVPCLRSLPVGWSFTILDARSSGSTFWLNSDRDGTKAVTVSLHRRCDVRGATQVPSERGATRRYERVTRVTPGYVGDRYYTFSGGCITYHFNLRGATRGQPLAEIAQAVSFVARDAIAKQVRQASDSRLSLDPPAKATGT